MCVFVYAQYYTVILLFKKVIFRSYVGYVTFTRR